MNGETVCSILFLIFDGLELAGQLAWFSDGNETSIEGDCQLGTDQEPSRIKTNNDIGFVGTKFLLDCEEEGLNQIAVEVDIGEEGKDVLEQDSRLREVGILSQACSQALLDRKSVV